MPVDLVRDAAIDVLMRVFYKSMHLDLSLDRTIRRKNLSGRGRRFLTQLAYGTVRHRVLCGHALAKICHQPLEKLPPPIRTILEMAVFQSLFCDQVTQPSMVHTSVDLAKRRGHAGTARLVNAVLRRAPKCLDDVALPGLKEAPADYLHLRYSTPVWLVQRWIAQFGLETATALIAASCEQAPTTLRANRLKGEPDVLAERLEKLGIGTSKTSPVPEELTVLDGMPPGRSKMFQEGWFTVQDAASMLAAHLLEPQPGERVLDLCASPGGKTTHMAEYAGGEARITAVDVQYHRVAAVADNAARLGLDVVDAVCADGLQPPFGGSFDRVLVDAPCSGLGTLRRNPDIKCRMNQETITRLAQQQQGLLLSAIDLCKNGGLVVYSVCTLSREETEDVVQTALERGLVEVENGPELFEPWKIGKGQYRTLPSNGALDGFFLTRLRKVS